MKKILLLITAILILFACKKKTSNDTLLIDTEHVSVEGSFVQGTINSNLCKAVIPYSNSNGGTAEIIADEVNGLKIEKQSITLNNATGEIKVNIVGTPLLLQSTFLQVQIKYGGETYITSVEIPIASDPNPEGTVTFTIDNTPIVGLTTTTTLNFTVDPTMTAIINTTATPVQGLTVTINPNSTTGQGTVTFTPGATFMGGTVQLTAQFGARPTQVVDIPVSYFATGDGTSATTAFPVTDAVSLAKVQYGTATQYFKVMNDFDAGTWTPMASFNTNLDGNSKTITYNINTPTVDSVALIKKINGGTISNLTLKGTATGKSLVAGLATYSTITPTGCTSTVNVTGTNNLANLIASGAGKDASVLVVSTLPTAINIVAPASSGSVLLGIIPANGIAYNEVSNATGATMSYNNGDGKLTATLPGSGFTAGDVTYYAALTSAPNVHTSNFKIALSSKPMFESGTGTAGDPYMVVDADQLNQTMINFPTTYIKVKNDISITSWTIVPTFSGNLDGQSFHVSGLNSPMIDSLIGTVKNIKIVTAAAGVSGASTTGLGILANIGGSGSTPCTIQSVGVQGKLTSTTTSGDAPIGGLVGELNGGTIDNCYAKVDISIPCSAVGGIVGRVGNTASTPNVTISNCTSEGTMVSTVGSITKIGGILGRRQQTNVTATYLVTNCQSSMAITITTGTGSNIAGGIFGANQHANTNTITIDQCLFTGTVAITDNGGGISGVGGKVTNCMVIGTGASSATPTINSGSTTNAGPAGIVSAVKDDISKCIVVNARIMGGSTATRGAGGIASDRNANTPNITGCVVVNTAVQTTSGRSIIGLASNVVTTYANFAATFTPANYFSGITYSDATPYVSISDLKIDGTAAPATMDQAWYTTLGYDFTNIWKWDAVNNRPALQNVGCNPSVIP